MLQTKENVVRIEGILSEINLKTGSFEKNGKTMESVGGVIKIRVNQEINGVSHELEIPVHMFATKYTNAGAVNPVYESICRIMNEYVSIAASDIDHADRVRITNGKIEMNEYYGPNGNLISFPRISASSVYQVTRGDLKPCATFSVVMMVGNKSYETDADGVETGRYKVVGMIPQYGGKVDVVTFFAQSPMAIDGISNYWTEGGTFRATGKLNFTSRTETRTVEVDFGEPTTETRTVSVSELIITAGKREPLEGDFAIDADEVTAALAERKARLAALKDKVMSKPKAKPNMADKFRDLGF